MATLKLADGSEVNAFTEEEVRQKIEAEVTGLKAKVEELLGESKSAKQKARELEELQRQHEEDALKKREEFKTLYEREQKSKSELEEKYLQFAKKVQEKEIESASTGIAAELTRDTKRAALLKKEIAQFAKYTDDGVKYEMGGIEVTKDKVIQHLQDQYPFLIDGSGASGGGATGGASGGAGKGFAQMSEKERVELYKRDPEAYRRMKSTGA